MTGQELQDAAISLFGERGWQQKLADALGLDRSTVWRHITNDRVPGPVSAAVRCWMESGAPKNTP